MITPSELSLTNTVTTTTLLPRQSAISVEKKSTSGWLMNILRWLLKPFAKRQKKTEDSPTATRKNNDALYPSQSADTVAINLGLAEQACLAGSQNLPRTTQSRELAALEQRIDSHIVGLLNDARTKATQTIIVQDKAFRKIGIEELTARIDGIQQRVTSEFKRVFSDASEELTTLRDQTNAAKQELSDFKNKHNRQYPARYPESRTLSLAILVVLLIAETMLNAIFFAEGSDLGLLGGATQAFSLALINITLAGLIAHYPMRWIIHRSTILRIIGVVFCIGYFICLSLFLMFISRYRHAFVSEPESAFNLAYQAMISGSWFPQSETSIVFFLLSIVFALIALFDVYQMDDPYPRYGCLQRRWENARDESSLRHEEVSDDLEELCKNLHSEQNNLQAILSERLNRLESISATCEQALTGWYPFVESVQQLRKALLAQSREWNLAARTTDPPDWFAEQTPLSTDAFKPPQREVPDTDPIHAQIREFQSRSNDIQVLLLDQYTIAKEELNKFVFNTELPQ